MKRSRQLLLALLAAAVLVTGCARQNVLEDLGLILVVGYDVDKSGMLKMTVAMPEVSEEATEKVQIITSKGDLSKEARSNISMSTDRQVVSGQLRTAIFSETLARQGVLRVLDTLQRDVNITSSLILCISDGTTQELINGSYRDRPQIGKYIFELLRKEAKNYTVPRTTLHDFIRQYHSYGADPIVPYVKKLGGNVSAAGTALFRDDKFVGSLSPEETKMLLLLRGSGEGGDIKQALRTGKNNKVTEQIMLTFVRADHRYKVSMKDGNPVVVFEVEVAGQVVEYTGPKPLSEPAQLKKVERAIERGLTVRMKNLLDDLQNKYHSDPIGIGEHIRANALYPKWSRKIWRESYSKADVRVNFKLNIIRTGIIK
ncbi:spore germination protein [Tumebacillus sp. BK434]|uniref:Ger(x)C family spore germination protein n=1 Tax=Tumebacillus sp. BK434 TaxID=2512169 RepID=UPI00104A0C36|nr:Ger(x)C family spore germination protein [Tumebacillus sp. BK434]TCP57708.1 spore germination protein [Tumebacillus sp. BK434]